VGRGVYRSGSFFYAYYEDKTDIRESFLSTQGLTLKKQWALPHFEASHDKEVASSSLSLKADVPGRIVKISVSVGEQISSKQVCLVLESMKMEFEIKAPRDSTVQTIFVKVGDQATRGQILIQLAV
jgi:biotin carboxyl carrier protein